MSYKYYKDKYKQINIKLDRVQDADLIALLESWPKGPKHAIILALRVFKKAMRGGLGQ